jgi:hypothetical protein
MNYKSFSTLTKFFNIFSYWYLNTFQIVGYLYTAAPRGVMGLPATHGCLVPNVVSALDLIQELAKRNRRSNLKLSFGHHHCSTSIKAK